MHRSVILREPVAESINTGAGHLGLWAIIVDCMLTKQRVFYAAEEDPQDQNVLQWVLIDSAMDSLTVNWHACVGCKCAGF